MAGPFGGVGGAVAAGLPHAGAGCGRAPPSIVLRRGLWEDCVTASSPATDAPPARYDDLRALVINCTLKRSPETSNTQGLIDRSTAILDAQGVHVDVVLPSVRVLKDLGGIPG